MNQSGQMPCLLNHQKPEIQIMIVNGPCTIAFVFIGLVGNIYGLCQLSFIQMGKNFHVFLRTLSLWDMSVLVFALLQYGLLNMAFLITNEAYHLPVWSYLANLFHGPLVTALTGSCWTTVAIAIVRYIGVARPASQLNDNCKPSIIICVLLSVCAVCYCVPIHFEVTLADCFDVVTQRNEVQIWPRLFLVEQYRVFYRSYAYLVFVSVGPFVAILGLSVRTLLLVRRSIARTRSCRSSHRQRKLAILFSVLLLKFVVCNLPATGLFLLTSILGQGILNELPRSTMSLCNFTALLHNATNFLLYLPWYKSAGPESSRNSSKKSRTVLKSSMRDQDYRRGTKEIQPLCETCPSNLAPHQLNARHSNLGMTTPMNAEVPV